MGRADDGMFVGDRRRPLTGRRPRRLRPLVANPAISKPDCRAWTHFNFAPGQSRSAAAGAVAFGVVRRCFRAGWQADQEHGAKNKFYGEFPRSGRCG